MTEQKFKQAISLDSVELINDLTAESLNGGQFRVQSEVYSRYFFQQIVGVQPPVDYRLRDTRSGKVVYEGSIGGVDHVHHLRYGLFEYDYDIATPGFQAKAVGIDITTNNIAVYRTNERDKSHVVAIAK